MRTSQIALANFAFPAKIPFSFATTIEEPYDLTTDTPAETLLRKTDFFVSVVVACGNYHLSSRNVPSGGHEERGKMAVVARSRQNFVKFLQATRGKMDAWKSLTTVIRLDSWVVINETNKQTIKNNLASGSNHSKPFCQEHLCVDEGV